MSAIQSNAALRSRIKFFYAVMASVVLVLFCGLAYRQLLSSEAFQERERLQNQRRILIPGPRGEIYDREGRVLVANRPRFSAVLYFSDPRLRRELRATEIRLVREVRAGRLERPSERYDTWAREVVVQKYLDLCGRILGREETLDRKALERHFAQQPLLPYPVLDELSPAEFAALVEQIPVGSPLQIYASTMRHYPYGSAASHTLGYVKTTLDLPDENLPGGDLKTFYGRGTFGETGLERQFDDLLQGETGSEIWIVDNRGIQAEMVENQPPVTGRSLYTSLDIDLQLAGEEALGDREGAIVALDVKTGEVLALVSKPDFDLNELTPVIPRATWNRIDEEGAWINRATQGLYPPGSTFKIITAMAALRTGAITPETKVECRGYLMVGRHRFVCHNRYGHGMVDLRDAIKKSCNVFFYTAGLAAGPDAIAAEARRFGLDQPTGIELPFEEKRRMVVPDPAWKRATLGQGWVPGDTANMSIGQGFDLVTPMQMACFVASLARGETATQPTLLRRPPGSGTIVGGNHAIGLPPRDFDAIMDGMKSVVEDHGTGHWAKLDGVHLAGKTGTAQVRTRRGTLELAWFIVFGPTEDPSIALAVLVVGDQPDEANAGGQVAAPVAKAVLQTYFQKHPPLPPAPVPPAVALR